MDVLVGRTGDALFRFADQKNFQKFYIAIISEKIPHTVHFATLEIIVHGQKV
ncbi:hypothetical protein SAMN02799630_01198 [Paenibacillus sp. UNCCL117]|uniref:hypothetical protein n=1 Tax=unclassified Paenibacillus TaxID=185978 RepID=UPI00088729D7|nr:MULTISPECIES: hypothetical protein [unclassified Paenibacillus]SDC69208.1 hypothetical protein SAMN04488602_103176 [Paenibacillus sp. cl123]SFW23848.1 hypothetical protein SAMN02799630_01198 [Paenibacillus sp. UNCCL117]